MRFALAAALLLSSATALAAPFAYVPNEKSGSVSVIDTATGRVTDDLRTGGKPRGIAVSPDGTRLYVSNQEANALQVVDVASKAVRAPVALGPSPEGIALSRDGRWIAAAIEEENAVLLVDAAAGQVVARIATDGKNP